MNMPPMKAPAQLNVWNPADEEAAGVAFAGAFGDAAKMLVALQPGSPATYWVNCLGKDYSADEIVDADAKGLISAVN